MRIERLNWDSDFFGLRIGRSIVSSREEVKMLETLMDFSKEDFDLVYIFASHGLNIPTSKARLVDEKVVYTLSDIYRSETNPNVIQWENNRGVIYDLLHLALLSGKYSRFRLDNGLPTGSYERLYSRWIEQSVNHNLATNVFCYMLNEVPRGLVTLDNKNGVAIIGLVAIHEDFQHQGIGTAMMSHVIHHVKMEQCLKLSVATQNGNIPACRLYEKSGFVMESVTDVWHWWL